jgi:hypothetical protein
MLLSGHAGLGYFHARTGRFAALPESKNLTTHAAADIVAGLLNGDASLAISHMYFRYRNTSSSLGSPPAITRSTGRADYTAITGAGPNYEDYLRVPIVSQGKIFRYPETTTDYSGNAVYFTANSALSSLQGESPAHNYFAASGANGPSKIFQIALVAAPVPADPNQDRVFAVLNPSSSYTYLANSYPGAFWVMRLS